MKLVTGLPLLFQQFKALFKKNLLLSWRNKGATSLQLCASFFFVLLLFGIQKAQESKASTNTKYLSVTNPQTTWDLPIPPCEAKHYIQRPCFDFVWSGNQSHRTHNIVKAIMAGNHGRSIPSHKVKSFTTEDEADSWLYTNPMRVPVALHFVNMNDNVIRFGVQVNFTQNELWHGQQEDTTLKFQIPLQVAAEREIARSMFQAPNFEWLYGLTEFAHTARHGELLTISVTGPIFFLAATMFGFVIQIGNLATEKELKLRQAMEMTGLYDSAYWASWIIWEAIIALISSLLLVFSGWIFQFPLFKSNNFLVVLLAFYLFQVSMIGFALFLSTFISKASSGTTVGFSIFIVGFITQTFSSFGVIPYESKDVSKFKLIAKLIWSLFPPNLLTLAVKRLSDATDSNSDPEATGISWKGRLQCSPGSPPNCGYTVNDLFIWYIGVFALWFVLAIYLDNVLPNSSGVRKSIFYFLKPSYWTGKGGHIAEGEGPQPMARVIPDDEDVREEENIVKRDVKDGTVNSNVAVQICGLAKTYPGSAGCCCCCSKRKSPFHAVKGLWVNVMKDQLFCLLGPNGAGKTTTISCLTGITPVTGGDALVYGYSVRSGIGMSGIRKLIGVCPQFDILWDALTGEEHLHLFASLRGLSPSSIKSVAQEALEKVKLTESAKVRSRSYSGGMRRRLSVAIALLGEPKLVILDEPTTGMDPISRRQVWDIIQQSKQGRAIILTTHSMEEADVLSDRIGIMAKGTLRCIGNSIRLKSKFGTGSTITVSSAETNGSLATIHHEAVKEFFKTHLNVIPVEETKTFLTFVIPHDKQGHVSKFLRLLRERKREFGIAEPQYGLATLEEVFLNIAKQAELESATAEGKMVTLTLRSGKSVEIPVGSRFVGIPGTETGENPRGILVEVYWGQDESGSICISGHSDERPVPYNVQRLTSRTPNLDRSDTLGKKKGPLYGIVYNPNQILEALSCNN